MGNGNLLGSAGGFRNFKSNSKVWSSDGSNRTGVVGKLIERTKRNMGGSVANEHLSKNEIKAARRLLDLYAFSEDWDGASALASRVIMRGVGPRMTLCCYRYWIEALAGSFDLEGLHYMAKHLLKQRFQDSKYEADYLSLAVLALTFSGRMGYARAGYRKLVEMKKKQKHRKVSSRYVWEAISSFFVHQVSEETRLKGVSLYVKLSAKFPSEYLVSRGALAACDDSDEFELASTVANAMHKNFRLAPEPYLLSGESLFVSGIYQGAQSAFQKFLELYPTHEGAIIALSQNLLSQGEFLQARALLTESAEIFYDGDFDYANARALAEVAIFEKYKEPEQLNSAIRWCAAALKIAKKIGLPESRLNYILCKLNAGAGEEFYSGTPTPSGSYEQAGAEIGTSPKVWIVSASSQFINKVTSKDIQQIKCPEDVRKGDFVFFSVDKNEDSLLSYFISRTNALPDRRMGCTVFMEDVRTLNEPISVFFGEAKQKFADSWGCENFSARPSTGSMYFSQVDLNFFSSNQQLGISKEKLADLNHENVLQLFAELGKVRGAS